MTYSWTDRKDSKVLEEYSRRYCTVSMFRASLLILYAGTGNRAYVWAFVIEPSVVELDKNVSPCQNNQRL
jgi:hypothetical protein